MSVDRGGSPDPSTRRGLQRVLTRRFILAREDGRIERRVEEQTGRGPDAPGRPNRPEEETIAATMASAAPRTSA